VAVPAVFAGRRVLIVDNSPISRQMLRRSLEAWGLLVGEVSMGSEALEALSGAATTSAAFDLVLFDLYLPDLDGLSLAHAIRSNRATGTPHMVMMTPMGSREEVSRVAAVAACLARPLKQTQLRACLAGLLARPATEAAASPIETRVAGETPPSRIATAEPESAPPPPRPSRHRILVADDNPVNLYVALGQLEAKGHVAEVVSNGREALLAMERHPYDLVLMDCQMPEMDGFEATAEIRRREGDTRHTIVVAMTAHALEGDRERCIASGMDDYMAKPMRGDDLARVIEHWLSPDAEGSGAEPVTSPVPPMEVEVDMNLLRDAACDDDARLHELLRLYFSQTETLLLKLNGAILAGSAEEVRQVAHRLAGSSASCGMIAVVPAFRDLERMGRDGSLADAPRLFAELEHRFERLRSQLRQYLDAPPAMQGAA
jgi:CheY-like chemotaxis protein